jgi:hypothetical protein
MKKSFSLIDEKKATERVVEAIKHQIKKYIARERRKKLPENVDFWDFDCKVGGSEGESSEVHVSKINSKISEVASKDLESVYIEILSKPGYRARK